MEGITILYTYTYTPCKIEFLFCLCVFFLFFACALGSLLGGDKQQSFIASLFALVFLVGSIITFNIKLNNSCERYEVIVNGPINFLEFNEKYKTVEVRGEIYTIEERVKQSTTHD